MRLAAGTFETADSLHLGPVSNWLHTLGLGRYTTAFAEAEIDIEALSLLVREDLPTLGVTKMEDAAQMMRAVQKLQQTFRW